MKTFKIILLLIALALLGLNISGLFKSMRNPGIFTEEINLRNRVNDVTIGYPEINEMLVKKPGENNVEFAIRINKEVNSSMAHYWKTGGIEKYHLRVPAWENYLLYAASYINPKRYKKYEFSNYKKNLERGVGLCSTHSTVVKGVLLENGIKAELLDVGGHHVVVRAELDDNNTYMLDPDYGIFVPHDTAAITANPELVREAYRDLASHYYPDAVDPYTTDYVTEIYGHHKHVYSVSNWFEGFSYWAIWIIPFLLMIPFLLSTFRKR